MAILSSIHLLCRCGCVIGLSLRLGDGWFVLRLRAGWLVIQEAPRRSLVRQWYSGRLPEDIGKFVFHLQRFPHMLKAVADLLAIQHEAVRRVSVDQLNKAAWLEVPGEG